MKNTFSYSPLIRIGNIIVSVLMIFSAGNLGYRLFHIIESSPDGRQVQVETLVALSVFTLLILLNAVIYLTWEPDFIVQDDGIVVKVYHFWERTILWEDVIEVKHRWMFHASNEIYVVVIRRLTPLHIVIGMIYGLTLKPAFVITRTLKERQEAANLITSQIAMKSSKAK